MSNILAGSSSSMNNPLPASYSAGSLVSLNAPVRHNSAVESALPMSNDDDGLVDTSSQGTAGPSGSSAGPSGSSVGKSSSVRTSTVVAHSQKRTISSQSGTSVVPYLFQNATITGGTINITINTGNKRRRETDSQEEIISISQED